MLKMNSIHADIYKKHLMDLSKEDRTCRFSSMVSEDFINNYVNNIKWSEDIVLGIFNNDLELDGVVHVALVNDVAEIGISVSNSCRKSGYGFKLFEAGMIHARNRGARKIWTTCSRTNNKMVKLAMKHGLELVCDTTEVEGHLEVPPGDAITWMIEQTSSTLAIVDYVQKFQSKNVQNFWKPILYHTPLSDVLEQKS
jgi:RimJ/RimL family protein N-acetyltransferase